MVRFMGYARKREPKWPYVAMAFIILMVAAVVLFIFSAITQWLESEAKKPVTTTTTTVSTTVSTTTLAPATTTTSLAPAKKAETAVPAAAAATVIKIERIAIASGVESNQPVDDLAKVSVGETSKLYCYVNLSNAGNSQAIRHVWIGPGGKVAAEIDLTARGGASTTWSYINIAGLGTGQWQVRVETKDGTVLAKKAFETY
jgi:hypothetical protein